MVEKVRQKKKSKSRTSRNEVSNLIKQAVKAKSGYDYPAAIELFDQALAALDQLSRKNGADENRLLEDRYAIHDGRAECYNWMAESNQEITELKIMEGLATQLEDQPRRINVINRQAEAMFGMGDLDEGERLSELALKFAREFGEQNEEGQSLTLLSQIQFQKGESENARHNNEQALAIFKEIEDLVGQSRCLRNMAFNGVRSGHTKNIQQYAEQALDLARQAGDHRSEASSLNVLGIISSDVSRQRDYYKQALEIFTTIGDEIGKNTIANNLGLLFWRLGLYGQANYYATQSANVARSLGNKKALAITLDGVGRTWLELGDLDRAEDVFQEGLILSREYSDAFDVAACLMGLGRIAYERGDYQTAIEYFNDQVELLRGKGDVPEIAVILAWMGTAYLKMGDHNHAKQATSEAVTQLLATVPNTDLLDQEVWWSRYQVLKDQSSVDPKGNGENENAWLVLDRARVSMVEGIAGISDEGLRRNYLTKVPVNRNITEEWAQLFHNRPEFKEFTQPAVTTGNLQEQFKRLSEIGSRLSTQRDPHMLPDFIMNEVVELNGAERAFLATRTSEGDLEVVSYSGLSKDQAIVIVHEESLLVDQAIDTRYAIMKEKVGGVPEGEVPELHQRSVLAVPLVSHSQVLGVIYTDLRRIFGSFNQNDIDLLTVLANQAASALESANWTRTLEDRVEERTAEIEVANALLEQQNADLAVINEIQQGLAAKLDFQEIIDLVGDKLITIFPSQELSIMLYDAETNLCHWSYAHWQGKRNYIDPLPPAGFSGHIIKTGKTIVVNEDMERAMMEYGSHLLADVDMPKSMVYVPIKAEGLVIGLIGLSNLEKENAFDEASVRLLESLAASLGIALSNVRLFEETNQRAAELAVINSVQEGLVAELEMQAIYDLVGDQIRDLFDAQVTMIGTFDHVGNQYQANYISEMGERFFPDPGPISPLMEKLIEARDALLVETSHDFDLLGAELVEGTESVRSAIFVPLVVSEEVKGAISIQNIDREYAFKQSDVDLLTTLANSMSVALENARLFDETNQRAAELAVINSVQEGLAAELDMQAIYDLVGETLREVFINRGVAISIFDHGKGLEIIPYLFGRDERFYPDSERVSEAAQYFIDNRKPMKFNKTEEYFEIGARVVEGTIAEKSGMWVPLMAGEVVRGQLSVFSHEEENAFSDNDLRLLTTLANSMSVALENARLFAETNQRAAELAVINSVQEGLAAELDIKAIYDLVGDKIREVFDAQGVGISIYDHDREVQIVPYVYELGERITINAFPFNDHNRKFIQERKPVMFNTVEEYDIFGAQVVEGTKHEKSGMWAPLLVGETVKGRINVYNLEEEYVFDDADLRLLTTLASSMSVALENARLFDETNQRAAELAIINSVGEAMAKQLDVETISRIVGDKVRDIFAAEVTDIRLFNSKTDSIKDVYSYDRGYIEDESEFPLGHGLTSVVINSRKPLVIGNIAEAVDSGARFVENAAGDEQQVESYLGVPIIVGEQVIGVVDVQSYRENAFDDDNVRLLTTLAANMGVALENARLFQETNRRADETAALNEIGREISATLDQNTVLEQIARRAKEILKAKDVVLRLVQPDGTLPTVVALGQNAENFRLSVLKVGEGITGHVAETGVAEVIMNSQADQRAAYVAGTDEDEDDTIIFAPLKVRERVIGVMGLWRDVAVAGPFGESDLDFAVGLSGQAAIAIENARLFAEAEQRA
ncbi:MAG: GAF domain-containing protein, partial [Anaerolineales bacterium]